MSQAVSDNTEDGRVERGRVVLDRAAHLVTVSGRPVTLALQEFRLLDLLMSNADHVLATADILQTVWGREFEGDPSTIAVHVLRIRRKLDGASAHLRTVRGIGYVFDSRPVT